MEGAPPPSPGAEGRGLGVGNEPDGHLPERRWGVKLQWVECRWETGTVIEGYVHGYHPRENERLQDQAGALVDVLHHDTSYRDGSVVLEAGCGVGAQTVTLARRSPGARFTSVDISAASVAEARRATEAAGLTNVQVRQADIFALPFAAESFDHV